MSRISRLWGIRDSLNGHGHIAHMIPDEKIRWQTSTEWPELHAKPHQILAIALLRTRLFQSGAFLSVLFIGGMPY